MIGLCACDETSQNTGVPACARKANAAIMFIFQKRYNAAGVRNSIDLTVTLDQAYFDAKINHIDPTVRWYPTSKLKNVTNVRAETKYFTFDDDTKEKIRLGLRSVTALIPQAPFELVTKLGQFECGEWDVYIIDKDFKIVGEFTLAGKLYGFPIAEGSLGSIPVFGNNDQLQHIIISFDIDPIMDDGNIKMIIGSEHIGAAIVALKGLLDINMAIVSTGQTLMIIKLFNDFGSPIAGLPEIGLLITNFFDTVGGTASKIYNTTDSAAVTLTSVTEAADGRYELIYASQTIGDKLRITPVKAGRDYSRVPKVLGTVA